MFVCSMNTLAVVVTFPQWYWCFKHIFIPSGQMWKKKQNKKTLKSFYCLCAGDEVLYHWDKQAGTGTATGKKMCMRVVREVPISFCEVCMIYPAPQIVAQSDLVCSFTGFCFPRCGDKRWMDLSGLLWGIFFCHQYRPGWLR